MNTQKLAWIIIGVALIVAGVWYFISSDDAPADREVAGTEGAVAVVNGEEISRTDFETYKSQVAEQQGIDVASLDAETQSQFELQAVEVLISQALLEQAVSASGIVVSQEDIDEQIDATVAQFGGEEAFEQALDTEGLSEEDLRAQISAQLSTQTYLEQELDLSSVVATNEEVEAAYAQAAAQGENIPPLEDVRPQLEQSVVQQKQQSLLAQHIEELRAEADIEILL